MQLIIKYEPPRLAGIPGREVMVPHGIGGGLRNISNSLVDELDVRLIFMHKTACVYLKKPDGDMLYFRMQRGFRACLDWTAMQPNEETWYLVRPLSEWFPEVDTSEAGLYEMWWEVGTSISDRLLLRKVGQGIWSENNSKQPSQNILHDKTSDAPETP